ncbi:MAG TPA: hypothetical protein VHL59_01965 [Thermoanaerobaculia bacterium]|nr:hypothetical protein [Thermoanaerobaculia bacterium]
MPYSPQVTLETEGGSLHALTWWNVTAGAVLYSAAQMQQRTTTTGQTRTTSTPLAPCR